MGSEFRFTIRAAAATEAPLPDRRDLSGVQPSLRGKRVLVVDDNATNRRIVTTQLGELGTAGARDRVAPRGARVDPGRRALRRRDPGHAHAGDGRRRPWPRRSGRRRRALSLPLILFTSLGRREARAESEGFAAYLHKPIKPSQLFDALVSILADQPVHVPERGVPGERARPGHGEPASAPDPPGRGQRGEPEGGAASPGAARLPGGSGRQRARGHRRRRPADLRRGPHGRADAGAGRLRGLARDQPALARATSARGSSR